LSEKLSPIVPLVAAFTDDTSTLSEVRVARMVRFHLERGAKGFLVCGETGDAFQIAHSERKQFLEWVLRDSEGLPIWVNITAMTTSGVVDLCQHASRHGAKGAVVCPPPTGRFFAHEAKALLTAINRHGNLQTVFTDPEGKWEGYETPIPRAEPLDGAWTVMERACPDEMKAGVHAVTPFAMFGADRVEAIGERLEVFVPAMKSVLRHGGLNRAARAALGELGCDVGPARSPQFELGDEGKKILLGMLRALGA
jgi:dihydrodipicolinate synthase/N-acetylneuraminate lyase